MQIKVSINFYKQIYWLCVNCSLSGYCASFRTIESSCRISNSWSVKSLYWKLHIIILCFCQKGKRCSWFAFILLGFSNWAYISQCKSVTWWAVKYLLHRRTHWKQTLRTICYVCKLKYFLHIICWFIFYSPAFILKS